jgi:hypothetical protein
MGNDVDQLVRTLQEAGLSCLHLDVSAADAFLNSITGKGLTVTSTMVSFPQEDYSTMERIKVTGGIMPDDCWERNRELAMEAIR